MAADPFPTLQGPAGELARLPLRWAADLDRLEWLPTSSAGIAWLPLFVEPGRAEGGRRPGGTVLIRMEPGCGYEPHRHLGGEDVLVLQGGYADRWGEYRQGQHVHYPPGSEHAPVALGDPSRARDERNPACILYACVPGGIELLRGS